MALIIQKYGGTSVKDIDRIKAVAERIKATYDAGNQVVVVVSARAGVTNELIQRARQINPQANKREMDMLKLRQEMAKDEHTWKLAEIDTRADIEDMKAARRPHKSYGVQLLEKAGDAESIVWRWSFNLIFILFALLDWMISSVRPVITYWIFGLYAAVKTATVAAIYMASERALGATDGWREALDRLTIVLANEAVMTPFDQEVLMMCLAFYFGQRVRARMVRDG